MILALLLQGATVPAPVAPAPAAPVAASVVPRAPWSVTRTTAKGAPATTTSVWSADDKARLVMRCDTTGDPIVSLQIIPRVGFAAATPRPVSINVDDGGWLGTNWQFPGNGAFVSDDVVVTNLVAMLAHARSIRVRVIDPDELPVEAVFVGPPGDAPVRAVLGACGYELGKIPPRSLPKPAPPPAAKAEAADEE